MEQQKEGIRQEFMLLNWYLKEHLASAVRIAAFIGVFSLLCFLRNVPQDVTVYMIVLMAAVGGGRASGAGLPADHRILRAAVSGRTD
jgi:predicted deacetylase